MKPIAIIFHTCFFQPTGEAWPWSVRFNDKYMKDLQDSGLMDASTFRLAGISGGAESLPYAQFHLPKFKHNLHGLNCRSSNLTSEAMRLFCVDNPGWNVLHFHCKGVAHSIPEYASYLEWENRWINCMVNNCIYNWRTCVEDLKTHDSVGCHWLQNVGNPPVDHIWGGTFWWATSDFIATLPQLTEAPLVKQFGMVHYESRATSEQYIGLGPKLPKVKDYCVNGITRCP